MNNSPLHVFRFIESGSHSDKTESQRNRLKKEVIEKNLFIDQAENYFQL